MNGFSDRRRGQAALDYSDDVLEALNKLGGEASACEVAWALRGKTVLCVSECSIIMGEMPQLRFDDDKRKYVRRDLSEEAV